MDKDESCFNIKFLSVISYLGPLFFVSLFSVEKENKIVKFHCFQGIRLTISAVSGYAIVWIITMIFSEILSTVAAIIGFSMVATVTILWIIMIVVGINNVNKAELVSLPVIGEIAKNN